MCLHSCVQRQADPNGSDLMDGLIHWFIQTVPRSLRGDGNVGGGPGMKETSLLGMSLVGYVLP